MTRALISTIFTSSGNATSKSAGCAIETKKNGTALYLDFPLGVNRDGYDVWRERESICLERQRRRSARRLIRQRAKLGLSAASSRRHPSAKDIATTSIAFAIIWLWPACCASITSWAYTAPSGYRDGFSAAEGLYVHNQAQEYYAILCLESHRHHVQIVGENLGTVPFYVNEAMERHEILGMHVGIFGVNAAAETGARQGPGEYRGKSQYPRHGDVHGFLDAAPTSKTESRLACSTEAQAQQEHQYRAAQREALIEFLRSRGSLTDNSADPAPCSRHG